MKKLCLFDLDGTLINPYDAITKGAQFALASAGIKIPDRSLLTTFIGPPFRDSVRENYDLTENQIESVYIKYLEYFSDKGIYENTLYPGVIDLLEFLKKKGFILVIATSKLMVNAQKIADYLEFSSYFDMIIGSERDGRRSRKRDIINYILAAKPGYEKNSTVMIGDRKYDIIGAKETGIDSIGCMWGFGSREELEQAGATWIANSIKDLNILLTA